MGTSVGDSESEAESLNDHERLRYNEQSPRPGSDSDTSDENNDRELNYNYAKESQDEEEPEEEESSESESDEEDEFMKDRQTTEDYSAYRERIFDFTPKGYLEKKSLVEEIPDEEIAGPSGINVVGNRSEEADDDTEKRQNEAGFQLMTECISKAAGINTISNNEEAENIEKQQLKVVDPEEVVEEQADRVGEDSTETTISDQEVKHIEETDDETYDDEGREKTQVKDQRMRKQMTTVVIEELDTNENSKGKEEIDNLKEDEQKGDEIQKLPEENQMRIMTTEELKSEDYNEEDEDIKLKEVPEIDENEQTVDQIVTQESEEFNTCEETTSEKQRNHITLIRDTIHQIKKPDQSVSVWTFDEYLDEVEKQEEIARAEANRNNEEETSEEEEGSVTDMTKNIGGDSSTKENVQEKVTDPVNTLMASATLRHIMRRNIIKYSNDSDDEPDEDNNTSQTLLPSQPTVISGNGDGLTECNLTKTVEHEELIQYPEETQESNISSPEKSEMAELIAETVEDIEEVLNESLKMKEKVLKAGSGDRKQNIKNLLTGWKLMNENLHNSCAEDSEEDDDEESNSEESDGSTDDEVRPYYRKLDKSDSTNLISTTESEEVAGDSPKPIKSKEDIKKELQEGDEETEVEDQDTREYREMLTWELPVASRTVQILCPRKTQGSVASELCDWISKTSKDDKPEFEITPPKDIAEENDVIMYARRKPNIICNQNTSMYNEPGRAWDEIKPSKTHKTLHMSQNYPVFQKHQDQIIKTGTKKISMSQTSLTVSNKISEVREQMAEFSKRLDDFKERSRLAREEVIRDYNNAVEKELAMVDEIMKSREQSLEEMKARWNVKGKRHRKPCHIDESVLRKHFEDMGIIVEEEHYVEEHLIPNINRFEEKELEDKVFDKSEEVDLEEQRNELLDNISCEENMSESASKATDVESLLVEEEKKQNNTEEGADEDGIVLIDTDSYEEYLTTNEDEEIEVVPNNREVDVNELDLADSTPRPMLISSYTEETVLEKSGESYDEYFTTNGEDSEEYDERTEVVYEELENVEVDECFNNDYLMGNLEKIVKENEREDSSFDECQDNEDIRLEDSEGNIDGQCEDEERPTIRRNVTCSLEMQLAKKSDDI